MGFEVSWGLLHTQKGLFGSVSKWATPKWMMFLSLSFASKTGVPTPKRHPPIEENKNTGGVRGGMV